MVDSLWVENNGVIFIYRAAGVITDGQRVLLKRQDESQHWALPGGKVKMGEDSESALRRILAEDLCHEVMFDRLLWVVENHIEEESQKRHVLGLYYLAHLSPDSPWLRDSGPFRVQKPTPDGAAQHTEFAWFPYNPEEISKNLGTKIWDVSGTIKIKA